MARLMAVATILVTAGCSAPMRYVASIHQEPDLSGAPVSIELGSLEYSSDPVLNPIPGWFVAQPIPIVFSNLTDRPVLVEWDRSALIDPDGNTLKIIHQGVSYLDAKSGNYQSYQRKSLIAPRAKLIDSLIPESWIYRIYGSWKLCVAPTPGARFVASMTFDVEGKNVTIGIPFIWGKGLLRSEQ